MPPRPRRPHATPSAQVRMTRSCMMGRCPCVAGGAGLGDLRRAPHGLGTALDRHPGRTTDVCTRCPRVNGRGETGATAPTGVDWRPEYLGAPVHAPCGKLRARGRGPKPPRWPPCGAGLDDRPKATITSHKDPKAYIDYPRSAFTLRTGATALHYRLVSRSDARHTRIVEPIDVFSATIARNSRY